MGAWHASPGIGPGTRAGRVGQQVQYWWEDGLLGTGWGGQARTRGCQSHDHYPAPTTRLSISVFPLPSLITHIPHPASSLLRLGEGGGGGAPTPSPGGGSAGLGEARACDTDTVHKGGTVIPALGTPGWGEGDTAQRRY